MSASQSRASIRLSAGARALGAALSLLAFFLVGATFLDGYALDLGSLNFPTPRYVTFVAFWMLFGGAAAILLALAIARGVGSTDRGGRIQAQWHALSDRRFLTWACIAGFLIPLVLRLRVLHGAPLTDDESAYRFGAELIASGRLWVASPPLKIFFDQNFMVNDGRLYPVYFPGWPALLAFGALVHAPELVNPVLSALTLPALLRVFRHVAGSTWARAGVVLVLSAPFLQIAAATELSHTSCFFALAWATAMCQRTREPDATWRVHAAFAGSLALAFCIRPQSSAAMGVPLVIVWLAALRSQRAPDRLRAAAAFLVPAVVLAVLFLATIRAETGSPWRVGYTRYGQYMAENGFRFTTFGPSDLKAVAGFDFTEVGAGIARTAAALFRLNFDLFGWPSSFVFLLFAFPGTNRSTRLFWWMAAAYLAPMVFQLDWGVDTFGPLHAFELTLPLLALTVAGARALGERLTWASATSPQAPRWRSTAFSPALFGALIVTAWIGFVPVRLEAVRRIAEHINVALRAPERAGLHRAVIFAPLPFAPPCGGTPRHFVFFRPVNDPDLRNDILWVNQLNLADDHRLLETMPGRDGYVLRWVPPCGVDLQPLPRP